jgi:hypothetical protein
MAPPAPPPLVVASACPCPRLAQIFAIFSSLAAREQSTLAVWPAPAMPTPVTSDEVGWPVEVAWERDCTLAEPPSLACATEVALATAWASPRRPAAAGGGVWVGMGQGGGVGGWEVKEGGFRSRSQAAEVMSMGYKRGLGFFLPCRDALF